MSIAKESIGDGAAYVFRHHELGLLGRIVVQDITGGQCLVSLEVAGDPEDPMTDRRMTIFEPVAKDLVGRLELHRGRVEHVLGTSPPVTPPDVGELVESKLIPCELVRCWCGPADLCPWRHRPGRFEDDARRMYKQVVQMDVPTYVIGPALGDGPMTERPADILKIWPEREPMQRLRSDAFNPLLDQLAQTHCSGGSARQALDRMQEAGELHDQGTRRHRGQLCPQCFFYRRISMPTPCGTCVPV
jgi:hypothetical protein